MVSVCGCQGTMQHVHLKCVQRWHDVSGKTQCELCQQPYQHPDLQLVTVKPSRVCRCSIVSWWIWFGCVIYTLHACILWLQTYDFPDDMVGSVVAFFMANMGAAFLIVFIDEFGTRKRILAIGCWFCSFYPLSIFLQLTTFGNITPNVAVTYVGNFTVMCCLATCLKLAEHTEERETSI